jgi:hypothetical protein
MNDQDEQPVQNKYAHLPAPIRPEDLRTSHEVSSYAEPVGEADRERDWLLRTTGIFI